MTVRTNKKTVTFKLPFVLEGSDEILPAGAYCVETDEELLEGISFTAYQRIRTVIRLQAQPKRPGVSRVLTIDPNVLEEAIKRDQVSTEGTPEPSLEKGTY